MANYSELLNDINAAIYENNNQEIDALEVRAILREIVTSLGSGFLFKGIATPSSPSGTGTYEPDQNVFYIAMTAGTYTYLGGLVVAAGEVAFLCFDGTWTKKSSALLSTGSIVDNTTTEDATKPLSAKQGKALADAGAATAAEVTALGHKLMLDITDVLIYGKAMRVSSNTPGQSVTYSQINEASWYCAAIPVSVGDSFSITGKGGNNDRLWYFIDSNGVLNSVASALITVSNLVLTSPVDGMLLLNFNGGVSCSASAFVTQKVRENIDAIEELQARPVVEQSLLDHFFDYDHNLFADRIIQNAELSSNGTASASATYQVTDFIEVDPAKYYMLNTDVRIYEYDATGGFIQRSYKGTANKWQVTANTHYVRANWLMSAATPVLNEYDSSAQITPNPCYSIKNIGTAFDMPLKGFGSAKTIALPANRDFTIDIKFQLSRSLFAGAGNLLSIRNERSNPPISFDMDADSVTDTHFAVTHSTKLNCSRFNSNYTSIPISHNWWGKRMLSIYLPYPVVTALNSDGTADISTYMPSQYEGMYMTNLNGVLSFYNNADTLINSFTLANYADVDALATAISTAMSYLEVKALAPADDPTTLETFARVDMTKSHTEYTLTTDVASGNTYYDAFPCIIKAADNSIEHRLRVSVRQNSAGIIGVQVYLDGLCLTFKTTSSQSAFSDDVIVSLGELVASVISSKITDFAPVAEPKCLLQHGVEVSDTPSSTPLYISTGSLKARFEYLAANAFTYINLRDYFKKIKGNAANPCREISMTFDDRRIEIWRDTAIRNIFQMYGVRPTLFYIFNFADLYSGVLPSGSSYPTAQEVSEMLSCGWGFETHGSASHTDRMSYAQTKGLFILIKQRWLEWFGFETTIYNPHAGELTLPQYYALRDLGFIGSTSGSAPLGCWQASNSILDAQLKREYWMSDDTVPFNSFKSAVDAYLNSTEDI